MNGDDRTVRNSNGNTGTPSIWDRLIFHLRCFRIGRLGCRWTTLGEQELRTKLDQSEIQRFFLRKEVNAVHAELSTLHTKLHPRRELLSELLRMSDEELRKRLRYVVRPASPPGQWEAVTQWCCCGGCELEPDTFATERDALLFAVLVDRLGCNDKNVACPECYTEYISDLK